MAKYDHGGGCACGMSRFCDCSNATLQDRLDREAYEREFPKKEKPNMALKQIEDAYDMGIRPPPNNAGGSMMSRFDEKPAGHCGTGVDPTVSIVDKGTLRVSVIANGIRLVQDVPMPAEVRKALEHVQRAAQAIRGNAS